MSSAGSNKLKFISHSDEETKAFGRSIGEQLDTSSVLCFFGDLGAGKTTLIKGIVAGATGISPDEVNSPTFVYLNIHKGSKTVYHFDLYRLRDADEFLSMGFDEYFFAGGICCVEWSEKIEPLLPPDCMRVVMKHAGEHTREITLTPWKQK